MFVEITDIIMRVHPYALDLMHGIYTEFGNNPFGMMETVHSVSGVDTGFFRRMLSRGFIIKCTERVWKPVIQKASRKDHWIVPTYRLSDQILYKIKSK
jgi:hypothetical protein